MNFALESLLAASGTALVVVVVLALLALREVVIRFWNP